MFSQEILESAKAVLDLARSKSWTLVTAESCTGGLVAASLTEIPGSSDVVQCGLVTYSNMAKTDLLDVPVEMIARRGAVSEEVARAMAQGALEASNVDLAVAVTGIAGPGGGTPSKPVGTVHIAAARKGRPVLHQECHFDGMTRAEVRMKSVEAALALLLRVM